MFTGFVKGISLEIEEARNDVMDVHNHIQTFFKVVFYQILKPKTDGNGSNPLGGGCGK